MRLICYNFIKENNRRGIDMSEETKKYYLKLMKTNPELLLKLIEELYNEITELKSKKEEN